MNDECGTGRRGFLKTVALAAGGTARTPAQEAPVEALDSRTASATESAASAILTYPRRFSGRQLDMIAFPLGGVAAGSISLGGRGQLRDWEVFNRPDKGRTASYAFAAVWARVGDTKPVVRVIESRLTPPYVGQEGLHPRHVSGLTRLDGATFTGEYPLAQVAFHDKDLPVQVTLEAFTPIIPLDTEESGLPVAVLRYKVRNPGKKNAQVSIAFSLDNPAGVDLRHPGDIRDRASERVNEYRTGSDLAALYMTNPQVAADAPLAGSFVLGVVGAAPESLTHLTGWPGVKWWASPQLFWDDFSEDGQLGPEAGKRNTVGSICVRRDIAPGAEAEYTFILAWRFPNRTPAWCGWRAPQGDENSVIGNHYCQRFRDAWEAAEYAASRLPSLEKRMRRFVTAMRESTLPAAVKDAAMANLSTLATPTCFRTADGRFRGFEGIGDNEGLCHGNCTHVWNYETTTQHLFPSLARSMREAAFEISERLDGVMPIRISLPEGKQKGGTTAADGTMGQIIKAYIDWQQSGDQAWLDQIWPKVKRTLSFAWVEGGWDGDRDGVMEGVQHNTYDVEFYGPNPMCGVYYLGALRAAEEMARAAGDLPFARECRRLFTSGSAWIDRHLFNGEYYVQKTRGIPLDKIAAPLRSKGGAEDPEHPDFQVGDGCLADQLIGQYLADVAGLGPLLEPDKVRRALASIYKYNHRSSLMRHDSTQRVYALNDEAAVLICDYGKGTRPQVPFPYYAEAWTGIEYLFGTQLFYAGMIREGVQCFEQVRRRFDGERRNPWDEPECGHHYARAMAAWSGIVALSGFRYRGSEKRVVATPAIRSASFSSFWSTATGWGTFSLSTRAGRTRFSLSVLEGTLSCHFVELVCACRNGAGSSACVGRTRVGHELRQQDGRSTLAFTNAIELVEGEPLVVEV